MASHASAVLVGSRSTWLALMQRRALQIQSINDFQPHGTWIEKRLLSEEKYLAISCCPDSQVWHPVWFHKVEFDICIKVQVLLHCSTYNLQFEVAGILCDVLLDSSPSSLALLPPKKSRLVSSKEPTGLLEQQPRNHGTAPHRDLQTQPVRTNQPPH